MWFPWNYLRQEGKAQCFDLIFSLRNVSPKRLNLSSCSAWFSPRSWTRPVTLQTSALIKAVAGHHQQRLSLSFSVLHQTRTKGVWKALVFHYTVKKCISKLGKLCFPQRAKHKTQIFSASSHPTLWRQVDSLGILSRMMTQQSCYHQICAKRSFYFLGHLCTHFHFPVFSFFGHVSAQCSSAGVRWNIAQGGNCLLKALSLYCPFRTVMTMRQLDFGSATRN